MSCLSKLGTTRAIGAIKAKNYNALGLPFDEFISLVSLYEWHVNDTTPFDEPYVLDEIFQGAGIPETHRLYHLVPQILRMLGWQSSKSMRNGIRKNWWLRMPTQGDEGWE